MSKPVKDMMMKQYRRKFEGVSDALLVGIRGINANQTRGLRSQLATKKIRVTVIKNHLAKRVFSDGSLAPLNPLIDGPTALVYGGESVVNVARDIIEIARKLEKLEVKGAVMEGAVFGPKDVKRLSQFPTRQEALADIVGIISGQGPQLVSLVTGSAGQLVSIVEQAGKKQAA